MPSELPRFTIRVDQELMYKLRYVAEKNHRSANKEIERLIELHVAKYEAQHGKIDEKKETP